MGRESIDDSDILCYRLKTKRRKTRLQRWDKVKQLLRLDKEETVLRRQKQNLGWVDLNPPIMRGYKRFFVLRPDIARGKKAIFYANILEKINTEMVSPTKVYKLKRRKFGRKIWVEKPQKLHEPTIYFFNKMQFTDVEKACFYEVTEKCKNGKGFETRYVFNEPWRFILRIRPNLITKVRERDEVIETRLREIDSYLETNYLRPKLNNLKGNGNTWRYWGEDVRKENANNPLWNKPLHKVLTDLEEEKI